MTWSGGRSCGGSTSFAGCAIKELGAADGFVAEHDQAGVAFAMCRRRFGVRSGASKLDPFKDEIHRLLKDDPRLTGRAGP